MRKNLVPKWAIPFVVSSGTVMVDGEEHEYHVLLRHFEPKLPGFLGFTKGTFLFVSEDVPSAFVPFVLGHEVREFTTLANQAGRCLTALQRELAELPNGSLRHRYIVWRRDFFERLRVYLILREETATELFKEVSSSLTYLRSLMANQYYPPYSA